MKLIFCFFLFAYSSFFYAQQPCNYSTNVVDSLGTYKSTKEYLMFQRSFDDNKNYIFLSLIKTDNTPVLNLQVIQKSPNFIKAECMDVNSRIYFQLANGKIITVVHTDDENCGTALRVDNQNTRISTGTFLFMKGSLQDLKSSKILMMRIKYTTGTIDYVMRNELISEISGEVSHPEDYFIDTIKCIE